MQDTEIQQNPRVVVIQKLYGNHLNKDSEILIPKHRYKKFIKDVVFGTIERKELIQELMFKVLKDDINENKTELMIKLMIELIPYAEHDMDLCYLHEEDVELMMFLFQP